MVFSCRFTDWWLAVFGGFEPHVVGELSNFFSFVVNGLNVVLFGPPVLLLGLLGLFWSSCSGLANSQRSCWFVLALWCSRP